MATEAARRTAGIVRTSRRAGRAERRRKMPRQVPPTSLMVAYARVLLALVAKVKEAYAPLMAALPALLAQRRKELKEDAGEARRARELLETAEGKVPISVRGVEAVAKQFAEKTQTWQRVQLDRQVKAALGVDLQLADPKVAGLVDGFTQANVSLIKGLPREIARRVEGVVTQGVLNGQLWGDMQADLEKQFKFGRNRAKLIAVDQIGKLYGDITKARHQELGVTSYTWHTVQDERVRPAHRPREGQVFQYKNPPWDGPPGHPIRCRCFADPVLDEIVGLAELDEPEEQLQPIAVPQAPRRARIPKPRPALPAAPPVPQPLPVAAVAVSPVQQSAKRLVEGLEMRGGVLKGLGGEVRRELDDVLRAQGYVRHLQSSVVQVERMPAGVEASIYLFNGDVQLARGTHKGAQHFYGKVAAGKKLNPDSLVDKDGVNSARALVHEVVHAHSPMRQSAYHDFGGRIEELSTEIVARKIVRDTYGLQNFPEVQGFRQGGAYQWVMDRTVFDVYETLHPGREHLAGVDIAGLDPAAALRKMKAKMYEVVYGRMEDASVRLKKQTKRNNTADEHLDDWLDGMGLSPTQRAELRKRIVAKDGPMQA